MSRGTKEVAVEHGVDGEVEARHRPLRKVDTVRPGWTPRPSFETLASTESEKMSETEVIHAPKAVEQGLEASSSLAVDATFYLLRRAPWKVEGIFARQGPRNCKHDHNEAGHNGHPVVRSHSRGSSALS